VTFIEEKHAIAWRELREQAFENPTFEVKYAMFKWKSSTKQSNENPPDNPHHQLRSKISFPLVHLL
jgi:hypothetical protein